MSQQGQQDQQPVDAGKEFKKTEAELENVLKLVVAVFNGEANLSTEKLGKDAVQDAIAELLQEERAEATVKFKARFKEVMGGYHNLNKFMKDAQKEFETKVTGKRKEFIKQSKEALSLIGDVKEIEKSYREGFALLSGDAAPIPALNSEDVEEGS